MTTKPRKCRLCKTPFVPSRPLVPVCRARKRIPDRLPSERCSKAVSSRNPPKRFGRLRLNAAGIPALQGGEDVNDTRIKLFYEVVFSRLAFELARKQEKAFWSAERSIPVDVKGSDTESGVWYAEICLNTKIRPALSISLLPGELRVGIVVPESFIFIGEKDLTPAIVGSFGEALDVTRNLPGHSKLFDRMVSDDPFTANLLLCKNPLEHPPIWHPFSSPLITTTI